MGYTKNHRAIVRASELLSFLQDIRDNRPKVDLETTYVQNYNHDSLVVATLEVEALTDGSEVTNLSLLFENS